MFFGLGGQLNVLSEEKLTGQEKIPAFAFILSSLPRDSMQILFFHLAES